VQSKCEETECIIPINLIALGGGGDCDLRILTHYCMSSVFTVYSVASVVRAEYLKSVPLSPLYWMQSREQRIHTILLEGWTDGE
jgi:hypothetical protein